jgi:hypothetical protein
MAKRADMNDPIDATEGLLLRIDAEDVPMLVRLGPPGDVAGKENEPYRGVYWAGTFAAWERQKHTLSAVEIILPETKPAMEWIDGRPVRKQ